MANLEWEMIHDEPFNRVRRIAIQGGWLYQVEKYEERTSPNRENTYAVNTLVVSGWYDPVFVSGPIDPYAKTPEE